MWMSSYPMLGLENSFVTNEKMVISEGDDEIVKAEKQKMLNNYYGNSTKFQD